MQPNAGTVAERPGQTVEIAGVKVTLLTHTASFTTQRSDQVHGVVDGIVDLAQRFVTGVYKIGVVVPESYLVTLGENLPAVFSSSAVTAWELD